MVLFRISFTLQSLTASAGLLLGVPLAAETTSQVAPVAPVAMPWPESLSESLQTYCIDCHDAEMKEGNLNLDALNFDLAHKLTHTQWTKMYDRVAAREMPPKEKAQPSDKERAAFLQFLGEALAKADRERASTFGRSTARRLNRYEYENTLRDLLRSPWLKVKERLPEDGTIDHFNKVAEGLDVSHIQMSRYMNAADEILRESMIPMLTPPKRDVRRYYMRDDPSNIRRMFFSEFNRSPERATFPTLGFEAQPKVRAGEQEPTVGEGNPELRELEGIGVVASSYEPIEMRFGRFIAPVSGKYRIRFHGHSIWVAPQEGKNWERPDLDRVSKGRRPEPVTFYAESRPRQVRYLKSMDFGVEPTTQEMEVNLTKGEFIRWDAARLFRSRPPAFRNPLATPEGQPGMVFRWIEVEGPLLESWPSPSHKILFGNLPVKRKDQKSPVEVISENPKADADKLMRAFLARAYRQPYTEEELKQFLSIVHTSLDKGNRFVDAMISGYTAVLCSPKFLWVESNLGKLNSNALASRLSYFLWNTSPDAKLREADLTKPEVLQAQANRLIDSPRVNEFVSAFLDYWMDLRKINDTSPDSDKYPEYYLDDLLVESATLETQAFLKDLLRKDLPARNLISSDYAFLNERLAQHYGLPPVNGVHLRKVKLPKDTVRGGLMTQASVLKVTANGTETSPVIRGTWIMDRVLGKPPPPPPPGIPAIEPDTRGAVTLRQILEKHRAQPECALCHTKIDPAGFALENFDVFGGYRDAYRLIAPADGSIKPVEGRGKHGNRFAYYFGPKVDASGHLPEGGDFTDIKGLKTLILKDERQVARNLVERLITYATGAPVRFGDRAHVEQILDAAKDSQYGVRTLVTELLKSPIFLQK